MIMPRNVKVTVVIPTRNRPLLVRRAVASALGQTMRDLEVLVVVDGPDQGSISELEQIQDPRLRVVALDQGIGGSQARNRGVTHGKGEWIAFLDDDDEWFPEKLEKQLAVADTATRRYPVVACRLVAQTATEKMIWPKRLPRPGEFVGDYLFHRKSLFQGETLVQTSMILAPRELLLEVPFRTLPRHQEWDWLLRASEHPEFQLLFEPTPQTIWNIEENRARISTTGDNREWESSLRWISGYRHRITRSSYANFLMTVVADIAGKASDKKGLRSLLAEAVRNGRPNLWTLGSFLAIRFFPKQTRHRIRQALGRG